MNAPQPTAAKTEAANTRDRRITQHLQWVLSLYRLGQNCVTRHDEREVFQEIVEHIVRGFSADSGSLAFLTPDAAGLELVAGIDLPASVIGSVVPVAESRMGSIVQSTQPALMNDNHSCGNSAASQSSDAREPRVTSSMCWPLRAEDSVIGVLNINRGTNSQPYNEDDLEDGQILIDLIGVVLENARLHKNYRTHIQQLESMNTEMKAVNGKLENAQNQLLQSEKMASIGQLAAGVAHEINNPMGYVNSNLGTLKDYLNKLFYILDLYGDLCSDSGQTREIRTRITKAREEMDLDYLKQDVSELVKESQEGVSRVKQIVQDLKDFSNVDEAEWQWTDLHKNLDSTLNIAQNEIKYKAEVVKEYAEIPPVECMPSQINQVLMNFLVNAAHAIEKRGTITLRTGTQSADWVWVEVSDTGTGIRPENVKRIFDPFFTTKAVGAGTGLGLSLSYGIVQKHDGRIEVESELGKGTTFRMWLPRQQSVATTIESTGGPPT